MTPAQRELILAALGLEKPKRDPRWDRKAGEFDKLDLIVAKFKIPALHRWSWKNSGYVDLDHPGVGEMVDEGLICPVSVGHLTMRYRVTRRGAEAAGVLGRCRREDVGR